MWRQVAKKRVPCKLKNCAICIGQESEKEKHSQIGGERGRKRGKDWVGNGLGSQSNWDSKGTSHLAKSSLQVQRFRKTRSFVKDQVLLDLFVRLNSAIFRRV